MADIQIDTWLYGKDLAAYAGEASQTSFANVQVRLPEGSSLADLLASLHLPTEKRGITFINGELSAMVGMQNDLGHLLKDGDRVAFFHLNAMWPFQYRLGAAMTDEMQDAMMKSKNRGVHHSYQ